MSRRRLPLHVSLTLCFLLVGISVSLFAQNKRPRGRAASSAQKGQAPTQTKQPSSSNQTASPGSEEWVSTGSTGAPLPNNDVVIGPVFAIAVDPRDANIVYAGAAEGGVWKTWNGGQDWKPMTDFNLVRDVFDFRRGTTKIGALAIAPDDPNIVYAGTSEFGVFRSPDGGDTWTPLGLAFQSACVNHLAMLAGVNRLLVVNDNDARVIYAATNLGLMAYREDGRDCWESANGLQSGNTIDLVRDPHRGMYYASVANGGIFRSGDPVGQPWQKLSAGLPADKFGQIALAFGGRAGANGAPPDPIVYAGFEMLDPYRYRLFKTIDGGTSWSELPSPPSSGELGFDSGGGTQLFWNNALAVGPTSSDDILVGHIGLWRAFDGGKKGGFNNYKYGCPTTTATNSWYGISCCLADACANPFRQAMDLHGDVQDIVFAPPGSFNQVPWQNQILYVATDGGVARGVVDSAGTVRWQQATFGLAIGEIKTIALDPRNPTVTLSGLWHDGTMRAQTTAPIPQLIAMGDGYQTGVDAGDERAIYFHCNAGLSGDICRSIQNNVENIWQEPANVRFWSDPYRPGNLLRLNVDAGRVYRTQHANDAGAAYLSTQAAWYVIDPFGEKTGKTTTIAFRSARLEEQPVYYLGTDTGQIWRGSPEVGWKKLCECGGSVNGLASDLQVNERVYAVFDGGRLEERIKELSLRPNGTWAVTNIGTNFTSSLAIYSITSIVVDPLVPPTEATIVYIGTDVGIYRGQRLRLQQGLAAGTPGGTIFDWTWRRSPGVPNVLVTDIEVHQTLSVSQESGIIRAGTFGRGIWELRRSLVSPPPLETRGLQVSVLTLEPEDSPPPFNLNITVTASGRRTLRTPPFLINERGRTDMTLVAPAEVRTSRGSLKFVGWVVGGKRRGTGNTVTLKSNEAAQVVAYYEFKSSAVEIGGDAPRVSVSADVKRLCTNNLSHRVNYWWKVDGGRPPLIVKSEVVYPDKSVQTTALAPLDGSSSLFVKSRDGGQIRISVIATGKNGTEGSSNATVRLMPCGSR